jgi:chromosome segregation ATPase
MLNVVGDAVAPQYDPLELKIRGELEPRTLEAERRAEIAEEQIARLQAEMNLLQQALAHSRRLLDESEVRALEAYSRMVRTTSRLETELQTARQAQSEERNAARSRIDSLEQQIAVLVRERTEVDQRYSTILEHLAKQGQVTTGVDESGQTRPGFLDNSASSDDTPTVRSR